MSSPYDLEAMHRLGRKCLSCVEAEAEISSLRAQLAQQAQQINGWRELGEEMERILEAMTQEQRDDLLPDWFWPRLVEKLAALQIDPRHP